MTVLEGARTATNKRPKSSHKAVQLYQSIITPSSNRKTTATSSGINSYNQTLQQKIDFLTKTMNATAHEKPPKRLASSSKNSRKSTGSKSNFSKISKTFHKKDPNCDLSFKLGSASKGISNGKDSDRLLQTLKVFTKEYYGA